MAWNPEPKVADLRDIAKKWKKHHVITLAWDDDELHLVTFGADKAKCAEAAKLGDTLYAHLMKQFEDQ